MQRPGQQPASAQAIEVRAVGTLDAVAHLEDLIEMLMGLSGAPAEPIEQLEVVLASPPAAAGVDGAPAGWRPDLRLQHDLEPPSASGRPGAEACEAGDRWTALQFSLHLRGKQHAGLAAAVRHVTRAQCTGGDVPAFWRSLGFAPRYRLLRRGRRWLVPLGGHELEVSVCSILRLPPSGSSSADGSSGSSGGALEAAALQAAEDVAPGRLVVEAVAWAPPGEDHMERVAAVGQLAALLAPYTQLQRPPRAPGEPA